MNPLTWLNSLWDLTTARGAEWRSWVAHAIVATLLSFLFGAYAAATFYVLRELEQAWRDIADRQNTDWADHFWDAWAPLAACAVLRVLGVA